MRFTIAHLSDAHLSPAPFPGLREMRLKRFMGYVNWKRGRERINDMAMLARLIADLRAQAINLVHVVQRRAFHHGAADRHRLEPCDQGQLSC